MESARKSNVCQTFVHSFSCLVRALTGGKGRKNHATGGKCKIKCNDRMACARPCVAGCKRRMMKCLASAEIMLPVISVRKPLKSEKCGETFNGW